MAEQWGGNSLSVATGQAAQRVFAAAFARGGGGVYKERLAGDVQLGGSAQCSLFCLTFDEFHQFYRTCQMPGVCRTPEGCTNDKAKQGLRLLSSLLSFFASQLCRMGTPICNMEKGRKIHPGHPWAAERGGGWPVQRAGNAVEPWKQMPAVIPILLVEKPIWEENKRWMRPQKEDKLEEAVASFISCFFQVLLASTICAESETISAISPGAEQGHLWVPVEAIPLKSAQQWRRSTAEKLGFRTMLNIQFLHSWVLLSSSKGWKEELWLALLLGVLSCSGDLELQPCLA